MAAIDPLILSVKAAEKLTKITLSGFRMKEANAVDEAAQLLNENEVAVVVFGPSVKPLEIHKFLHSVDWKERKKSAHIVLYDKVPPSAFQDLVDSDAIFYLARASIIEHELRETILAAARRFSSQEPISAPMGLTREETERLTDMCLTLLRKGDISGFVRAASEELTNILQATQARCLIYDPETDTLCADRVEEGEEEAISAAAGLVGYVARTGEHVRTQLTVHDPRYDPEADNPGGAIETHFIAQPLSGANGATLGVLTGTRTANLSSFIEADQIRIEEMARIMAPPLQTMLSNLHAQENGNRIEDGHRYFFRQEALDYQDHTEREGKLLRRIPLWLTWSHLMIVLSLIIGLAYVVFAKVNEITSGPAVIQVTNKINIQSLSGGVVESVFVQPGDLTTKDELLAKLQGTPGDDLLARIREEVRAPADGTVFGTYIRTGQMVSAGDRVLSLRGEASRNEVVALLPGSYAPQIHAGMPLILKVDGYPQSREELTIENVATDVIGPENADLYVGKEISQTLSLKGPILIVRCALPEVTFDTFESLNEKFRYHDGMVARAEVSVRKESLIIALVPGIKQVHDEPRIYLGSWRGSR